MKGTPLVHDGVMYGSLTDSVLFAVNARTGDLKWRWDPKIPLTAFQQDSAGKVMTGEDGKPIRIGPSVCCGRVNRGVALYKGKVYAGLLDGRLVALDANTGKLVWQVEAADYRKDYSITMAPRVVKGKVIIGNSGADYGVRGYVSAHDAETGKLVWRFYTVPGDPSKGFENKAMEMAAKTWKGEWWKMGGGGTVWDGMAYDPKLDLLYIGTGNGGPWVQEIRSPGGGDNLFLSSIVALRPDTGEYVWHYQTTPGDSWDYAATAGIVLADLNIGGRARQVLMQAPKNGFFYVLDRRTGEFLSAEPFTKVTWATGVDPKTGRPVEAPNARYGTEGTLLSPSPAGAHNWPAMSYNPVTKLAYIPALQHSTIFRRNADFHFEPGALNQGNGGPFTIPGMPPPARFLLAWDPVAQKERWRQTMPVSGTLTTRGNLVFAGAQDRLLRAYDAETGAELWKHEASRDGDFANPITYMVNGKQYVAVFSGYKNSLLLAFTLDGRAPMPVLRRGVSGAKSSGR